MDDRKLRTLLAVAQAGSLNAAAEGLNCTQSAVTQMMNSIEDELGFKVFFRTNRGVKLTKEGEAIMPFVYAAEKSLLDLAGEAGIIAAGKRTPLRIGTYSSISATLVPGLITAFRKGHPDAMIEILVGTEELPMWLESGKIHIVLADEKRKAGVSWYPVLEDPVYAVVPSSYRLGEKTSLTKKELMQYPLILNPLDPFLSEIEKSADPSKVIRVRTDDSLPQLRMASRELGIAFLPELSLRAESLPDNIDLLEMNPPISRTIGFSLPANPHWLAKELAAFLRKNANKLKSFI